MATIPLGRGGRVAPNSAPAARIANLGAVGQAMEQLGATGVRYGAQRIDQENRRLADEERRQQAQAEAAERARESVLLQNTEDELGDLHDEIGAGVLRGEIPKDQAEQVLKERAEKLVGERLGQFSPAGQTIVQPRLNGTTLRLGNSMRRTVEKKDREDVTADMTTTLERLQREYMTDPAKAQAQANQVFTELGPFSTLSANGLATARQKWLEQAQHAAGYAAVSRGRNDPQALAEAEKTLAGLTEIDPQRRAVLDDRIAGYRLHQQQQRELAAQRAERAAERAMRDAKAAVDTFQTMVDKGGVLAPEFIDEMTRATAGTPYQAVIKALAQQAQETGGIASQPLAVQRATLDAIDAEIATRGRSPGLDKRREQIAKVVTAAESDAKTDPLRASLERGVIQELKPLNMNGGMEGVVSQLQERVQAADAAGQWAGRSVSPLTAQEADTVARMLTAMPLEQKSAALAMISAAVPPQQAQALAAQLDAKDKPLALALAVGQQQTSQGRYTSELILRGAQAVKDKSIKEEKGAEYGTRALIAKEIGAAVPPAARDDVIEAARYIMLGKQAAGERVTTEGAVRLAIGGDLVEHNGRRVPVPVGVDLPQRLQQYPVSDIAGQAPDGFVYLPGGRPMGVPEFLAALPGAQLEPAGLGRFVVRSGGSLVMNQERKPIVVTVR